MFKIILEINLFLIFINIRGKNVRTDSEFLIFETDQNAVEPFVIRNLRSMITSYDRLTITSLIEISSKGYLISSWRQHQ